MAYSPTVFNNPYDYWRESECSTLPLFSATANSTGAITSGTVYACVARVRTSKAFANARICTDGTTASGMTVLAVGVWNSAGTLLTYCDLSSNISAGNVTNNTVYSGALNASQTLTAGQIVYLGIGQVASTTCKGYAGLGGKSAITGLTPTDLGVKISNSVTGFTAAASFPALTTTPSGITPWIELY